MRGKIGMTQNSQKIAITGGIGSGKSTVCNIIKELGYPVYSCDKIYKELLAVPEFINRIADEFGQTAVVGGRLNREALSAIVFGDGEKLKKLNSITHPAIMDMALKKMDSHALSFVEVPLLFENGFQNLFSGVIVVLRGREQRIAAVTSRDNLLQKDVELRIKNQLDYDNFDFSEYYVIHNCGNLSDLRLKITDILKKIESCNS